MARRLEKFQDNTPTSPEVIEAHMLNFKPNFKFSRLKFFGGTVPLSAASNSEIETGAITFTSIMIQRRAPCSAVQRRAAPCGADGAQTGAALLRRTVHSVNAT